MQKRVLPSNEKMARDVPTDGLPICWHIYLRRIAFVECSMKIVKLEIASVRFELEHPYVTAGYKGVGLVEKKCVIVRLHTDTGLSGVGESDSHPAFTYESPETVMAVLSHQLAPAVLGADPCNLSKIHAKMDDAIPGWAFAKGPIDVACYDAWGQSLGLPVYKLLGGALRDRVPLIWPIGGGTPDENARAIFSFDGRTRFCMVE